MLETKNIKTKRDRGFIMLQVKGNTLQGLWRKEYGYTSDSVGCVYSTIKEAKQHTAKLLLENYFGSIFKDMFLEVNSKNKL